MTRHPLWQGEDQPAPADHLQKQLHQLAERRHARTAELVDARPGLAHGGLRRRLGHVHDVDRLELRLGPHQRQRRREAAHRGETVEELVLRSEHDGGAQDHRVGKRLAHRRLALGLGAPVGGGALWIGADGGDLDETLDPLVRGDAGGARGAFRLQRPEALRSALGQHADAVDHRGRALHGAAQRRLVADVGLHRLDLSDIAVGPDEMRLVRAAHGDPHAPAPARHRLRDVAAYEARAADDGDERRGRGHPVLPRCPGALGRALRPAILQADRRQGGVFARPAADARIPGATPVDTPARGS